MRNLFNVFKNEDIFQTSKPLVLGAFLLIAVVITSLLSVRYYLYQNLVNNSIAQKTIYAKN